jgi:hypothetical protein
MLSHLYRRVTRAEKLAQFHRQARRVNKQTVTASPRAQLGMSTESIEDRQRRGVGREVVRRRKHRSVHVTQTSHVPGGQPNPMFLQVHDSMVRMLANPALKASIPPNVVKYPRESPLHVEAELRLRSLRRKNCINGVLATSEFFLQISAGDECQVNFSLAVHAAECGGELLNIPGVPTTLARTVHTYAKRSPALATRRERCAAPSRAVLRIIHDVLAGGRAGGRSQTQAESRLG